MRISPSGLPVETLRVDFQAKRSWVEELCCLSDELFVFTMNPFIPSGQPIGRDADQKLTACLVEILERLQYSVHSVGSASEATAVLLDLNPPRIILIDSALPRPSGIEPATEIKHRPNLLQTWEVLLSRVSDRSSVAAPDQAAAVVDLLYPAHDSANGLGRPWQDRADAPQDRAL